MIVEWPSAARAQLESAARKGVVVVSYEGCTMRLLPQCSAPGTYAYVPLTRKRDRVSVHDADELYANLPLGAASLEGKLASSGELNVTMTIVGRWESNRPGVASDALVGECAKATHVVTGLTAGAFRFVAGAAAELEAEVEAVGVGAAGGKSASKSEILNEDGDEAACAKATGTDPQPPYGCGALLRVEVVPIGQAKTADASCAAGLTWNGTQCVSAKSASSCGPSNVDACVAQCDQGAASACREAGSAFRSKKDGAQARRLFERACGLGDPRGCTYYGVSLLSGEGGPKDPLGSLVANRKACEQGEPWGCYYAGTLLVEQEGVPHDPTAGAAMMDKSCKLENAFACTKLGRWYARGTAVSRNDGKAFELFERVCSGNEPLPSACIAAGSAHLHGRGTTKDLGKGLAVLAKVCDDNVYGLGCKELGQAYRTLVKDTAKADAAYRKGCTKGTGTERALNCQLLGSLHREDTKDLSKAEAAYRVACEAGSGFGCVRYGIVRVEQKKPADDDLLRSKAAQFEKECVSTSATAQYGCNNLAQLTQSGFGITKDEPRALALFEKACELGLGLACWNAGQAAEKGVGTKPDAGRARALYGKSCDAKHASGCSDLARMCESGAGGAKDPVKAASAKKLACNYDEDECPAP